jgi:diaminohydroxyphosphoribosylaminopyrimidine deaminase/5-amino-6-(5-phosphoribosylamino)uracil reductase
MARALELAARGIGAVEPNPAVGAVLIDDDRDLIAEGWHQRFGGPHAEIEAMTAAGKRALGATLFVTLEPCCHQGKTGPCTEAIIQAGIRKVIVALQDPFPKVAGKGIERLRSQGIEVEVGLLATEAGYLAAPFLKLVTTARPWVHAKWAMSLDGKIATRSGDSRWISNEASRAIVHRLRGRMDGIIVGAETAIQDDPLLTARPPGPRVATRIVVDSEARLPVTSQLVQTARETPLLIAASTIAPQSNVRRLEERGVEVLLIPPLHSTPSRAATGTDPRVAEWAASGAVNLDAILQELGRRRFTNVLVEGGSRLLGSFFDAGHVDEVHVFVAPKIIGGAAAFAAVAGLGISQMNLAATLEQVAIEPVGDDIYINGRRPA